MTFFPCYVSEKVVLVYCFHVRSSVKVMHRDTRKDYFIFRDVEQDSSKDKN